MEVEREVAKFCEDLARVTSAGSQATPMCSLKIPECGSIRSLHNWGPMILDTNGVERHSRNDHFWVNNTCLWILDATILTCTDLGFTQRSYSGVSDMRPLGQEKAVIYELWLVPDGQLLSNNAKWHHPRETLTRNTHCL